MLGVSVGARWQVDADPAHRWVRGIVGDIGARCGIATSRQSGRVSLPEDLPVNGKLAPFRHTSGHRGAVLTKTQTTQSTFNEAFGCRRRERFESHPLRHCR